MSETGPVTDIARQKFNLQEVNVIKVEFNKGKFMVAFNLIEGLAI